MTLDDESLLTGYLDDELDAAERLAVESALQADPALAERLRELAGTRDLLAGLRRPRCPVDLSPAVTVLVERSRAARASRRRAVPILVSLGAIAASTLAVTLRLPGRDPNPGAGGPAVALANIPTPAAPAADPGPPAAELLASEPAPPAAEPSTASAPAPDPASRTAEDAEAAKLRELLSRGGVRRILIATDVIGAPEELTRILKDQVRKSADVARIYVHQGLAIDPDHPEQATVFAMVMDGREREDFLKSIRAFEPREVGVRPELIAQLNDVQDATWFRSKQGAGLGAPPLEFPTIALKADHAASGPMIEARGGAGVERPRPEESGKVGPVSPRGASQVAAPGRSKVGDPAPASEEDGPQVVLVWVTSKGGKSPGG